MATGMLTPRQSSAIVPVNAVPRFASGPVPMGQSITVAAAPTVASMPAQANGSMSLASGPYAGSIALRQATAGSIAAPSVGLVRAGSTSAVTLPPTAQQVTPMGTQGFVVAPSPQAQASFDFSVVPQPQGFAPPTPPPAWPSMQPVMPMPSNGRQAEPSLNVERAAPQALTSGLPDPGQIESQRGAYMKSLDDQLKSGADVLNQQLKQQQEYLLRMGDQQKRQYGLHVDQNIKQRELELVQQHNHQLLMLQQAAQQQKVALEQQANALLIEYNQKKATEDLSTQMYQFETQAQEAHAKYTSEIQALQTQQALGAQQLAAQGEALARQASMSNMQAIAAQQVASRTSASLTQPMPVPTSHRGSYTQPVVMTTPPPSYLPPIQPAMSQPPTQTMLPPTGMAPRTGTITPGASTPRQATTLGTYSMPGTTVVPMTGYGAM